MKRHLDWRDLATRGLIVAAGIIAAVLLVLQGHSDAIPALALGATLGAFVTHAAFEN